ncbi:hypothetical protein NST41_33240 [Paenibacillus sp. FSL L8-0696]|nr:MULTISPECIES: hypothetical protein [Paenibacillus]
MNLVYIAAIIQLVRQSIGLTKDIHSLFTKISSYIGNRKKH